MKEMKEIKKTGLMFDIVATKDIKRGEEVLLYYGKDWEDSWAEHIEEWILLHQQPHIKEKEPDPSTMTRTRCSIWLGCNRGCAPQHEQVISNSLQTG